MFADFVLPASDGSVMLLVGMLAVVLGLGVWLMWRRDLRAARCAQGAGDNGSIEVDTDLWQIWPTSTVVRVHPDLAVPPIASQPTASTCA